MDQETIERIKEFVDSHLKEDFSLSALAAYAGYTPHHLTRMFRDWTGYSVMEYVRNTRIEAAARQIARGRGVLDTALDFGFDTHAGFTKAFCAVIGCPPRQYARLYEKRRGQQNGGKSMTEPKIIIRPVCKDDAQDLWENVYSAMTPRQIMDTKIEPKIEELKKGEGIELVAQVDGQVVMSLPMTKQAWAPVGFLWDNAYTERDDLSAKLMRMLLDEMKAHAKRMGVNLLLSPQYAGSESVEAMGSLGFESFAVSGGWEYLFMVV